MSDEQPAPLGIDVTKPGIARVYDYLLGGKDNFAVDRRTAEMVLQVAPDAAESGRANRAFLRRVVRFLVAEAGVRQFIDIGSGLPTQGNVHEIAQRADPGVRVVYIDNDPIVLAHGRALLADNNSTTVIQADVREPGTILHSPAVGEFIDFDQPVGLLLFAILHHLNDAEDPAGVVAHFRDALPSGSYIAISHFHNPGEELPEVAAQAASAEKVFNATLGTGRWRTRADILGYFDDMELVEPGLVPLPEWRHDTDEQPDTDEQSAPDRQSIMYHTFVGGLARKA